MAKKCAFDGTRQVGHYLSTSRLTEIRMDAESILQSAEKNGAAAVAEALVKASESLPYSERAQLAVDLSKTCMNTGKHNVFEGVLDALLSQEPLSFDDGVDDLDFALADAEDDDTFVDVKTSNRSNMHLRHTHHHLGLTMAIFSSTLKERCLRALHDSNMLMYPKAALLLCSVKRSSGCPVMPDAELVALISDPCCIPRRACILMAACVKHKRTTICDELTAHFWRSHHHGRCAMLLPACSKYFAACFARDHPKVMTEVQFSFDRFLKAHPDASIDLLEAKLQKTPPLYRDSLWKEGPFYKAHSWLRPLLQHCPAAHTRLATLIRSYPALTFLKVDFDDTDFGTCGVLCPTFPLCKDFGIILSICKMKGKSNEFWSLWFPHILDGIAIQSYPVLNYCPHSAFDDPDREVYARSLVRLLDLSEDRENNLLVECLLRSHPIKENEAINFEQLDLSKFRNNLALAKRMLAHPALSRAAYQNYGSILNIPSLSQEQNGALFERIISYADRTEASSSANYMHHVAKLSLKNAFSKLSQLRTCGLYGASWPTTLFTKVHRFAVGQYFWSSLAFNNSYFWLQIFCELFGSIHNARSQIIIPKSFLRCHCADMEGVLKSAAICCKSFALISIHDSIFKR